ncbi:BTAD domain-containing putative transcriptional regulator [Streptomyces sp. NPDC127098]|uniref:AfsR/SARP family transcriptional regulator n=1 Tax=Streptomyces sp. NPDC127098 TaxID=3347137 RepID=UPI003654E8D2
MLEIRLLGPVEVRLDGNLVNIGHAKQRHVLAALLMDANNPVPSSQLISRVWGENPPRRADKTLYSYLSRLRTTLPAGHLGVVRRDGGHVAEVDAAAIDVHRFRELVTRAHVGGREDPAQLLSEALRLWRGEAFAEPDTPWFGRLRELVTIERQSAEMGLNEVLLRQGREAELLPRLVTQDSSRPFDERLGAQLMLALYRLGRTKEALEHYQNLSRRLGDELGLTPGATLRRLHQEILMGGPVADSLAC